MANNAIDLVASQQAIKGLEDLIKKLDLADKALIQAAANAITLNSNLSNITLPSGLTGNAAANAQLIAQLRAQEAEVRRLQDAIDNLQNTRNRGQQVDTQEIVNQRILARNAREQATINSTLAGSYQRLSAQEAQYARQLQDLIVRGRSAGQTQREFNAELRTAQSRFNDTRSRILQADDATGRWGRTNERVITGFKNMLSQIGLVGGVAGVIGLGKNIFETTKEIVSLDNALKLVTGTAENFAEQQSFLAKTSEDFGVDINGLTKQFTQFYVSAKDKLAGKEIQDIFRSVTKAGASMGLSVENQERAFLALNQMMSKGTIQAEELRGQLGEALPGALGIMAKAVGVNEAELAKMMKAGNLLAADVLPKFARQLEITYGIENVQRIDNLAGAQTRLANSWTNFVRSLDEDGNTLSKFFTKTLGLLSELVTGTQLLFESSVTKQQKSFKSLRENGYNETLKYYNSLDELNKDDIKNTKDYTAQKILEARKETEALKGRNLILNALGLERSFGMSSDAQRDLNSRENEKKSNDERIKQLNNVTFSLYGQFSALNSLLEPKKKISIIDDNDKITQKEKNALLRKQEQLLKAQEELLKNKYQREISDLERLKELSSDELDSFKGGINEKIELSMKLSLKEKDIILRKYKEEERLAKGNKDLLVIAENDKLTSLENNLQSNAKRVSTYYKELFKIADDEIPETIFGDKYKMTEEQKDALKEHEDKVKKTAENIKSYLNSFLDEFASNSGFSETFKILSKQIDGFGTDFKVTFNAIAESAQEAFNFISNISQQKFAEETARAESQYDIALGFANGNAEAEAKLAEDLANRKKDIANRENKVKQKQAIFNIAIDTAQAIVSSFKTDPTGILALIIGALGAVQIGVVSSQQIPQYFDGGVHDGGLAMINDAGGSNYVETVVTPDGKAKQFKGRDVVTNLPKGTEIFTPEQWHEKQLFDMMQSNNVSMPIINQQNNGITARDMDRVIGKHFSKIQVNNTTFDANGMRTWSENNGNRTIRDAKRVSRSGFNV